MTTVADLSCSMRTITKIFTLTLNWEAGRPFIRYIVNIDNSNNEDAHCPLSPFILLATTAQANRVGKITNLERGPCRPFFAQPLLQPNWLENLY